MKRKRAASQKRTKAQKNKARSTAKRNTGRAYQRLVAEVARAFDPNATVEEGQWVEGPDGRLDMDVSIRGTVQGRPKLIVVECKDFSIAGAGKVGRPFVDALDSKRVDLGADYALICSNAGFTEDALRKARRRNIGMISVLKSGDARVKVKIAEDVLMRRVRFGPRSITYHAETDGAFPVGLRAHDLTLKGLSLDLWLQGRVSLIASARATPGLDRIGATYRFVAPVAFESPHGPISLTSVSVECDCTTEWLTKSVYTDVGIGLYDYVRGQLVPAPGPNRMIVENVDFDAARPLTPEELAEERLEGVQFGSSRIAFALTHGMDVPLQPTDAIDSLIFEDDRQQHLDVVYGRMGGLFRRAE